MGIALLAGMFVGVAFGGKVLQKRAEAKDVEKTSITIIQPPEEGQITAKEGPFTTF